MAQLFGLFGMHRLLIPSAKADGRVIQKSPLDKSKLWPGDGASE